MKIITSLVLLIMAIASFLFAIGFYQQIAKYKHRCKRCTRAKLVDYKQIESEYKDGIIKYYKPVYKYKFCGNYILATSRYRYITIPLDLGEIVKLYYNVYDGNDIFIPEERNLYMLIGFCIALGCILICIAFLFIFLQ